MSQTLWSPSAPQHQLPFPSSGSQRASCRSSGGKENRQRSVWGHVSASRQRRGMRPAWLCINEGRSPDRHKKMPCDRSWHTQTLTRSHVLAISWPLPLCLDKQMELLRDCCGDGNISQNKDRWVAFMEMLQGYRKVLNALQHFYTAKNIWCAGPFLLPVCLNSASLQFSLVIHSALCLIESYMQILNVTNNNKTQISAESAPPALPWPLLHCRNNKFQ